MKLKLLLLTFILVCTGCKNDPRIQAAYDLIERVTPGYGEQFKLELMEPIDGMDAYEITSDNGKVVLRGNNTISLATAFNQYLKYTCNAHVSWFGNQLDLPKQLPMPAPVKNTINGKYRVYMNYCTVSYSAAWWDWERWQRELDFMAMNSINMPLSVVGLEAVWYNTLLKHKFTDEEARQFLAGPGHFAWQWMQNLQSYGGPLPKSWIDKHIVLGKQIIDRELELGMQPIQQGFSGYVPRELKEKYPDAKIQLQPSWCGFTGAAQLDPTDSLFTVIGRDFLEEEKKLYGAHGVYAADPFHESQPPVDTPEYLRAVGNAIHKLFNDFDPNSIWAMQAWSLREPIVKAVPKENLLILDVMMPKMNGYQVARAVRAKRCGTPILMLTARSGLEDRIEGLNAGADYYLTKPFDSRELVACINALLRRQGGQVDELTLGNTALDLGSCTLLCGSRSVRLSAKEFDVMRCLFQAKGSILSKEALLARVWGFDSEAVENNVEVYIGFLRKKLNSIGSNVTIAAVRRMGYRLEVQEGC